MISGNNVEEKINATLNSLDDIHAAGPRPFFYTRLQSRLNKKPESVWTKVYTYLSMPSIAMLMFIMVVLGDGMLFYMNQESANTGVSSTAPEYSLSAQYQEDSQNNQEFYHYAFDENPSADNSK